EARHIGDILPPFVALPGQPAVQPELAAHSYGTHGTNVSHIVLLRRSPATLAADGLLARTRADRRKAHDAPRSPPAALSPDHRPAPKAEGNRADGACHHLLCPARRHGEIFGHRESRAGHADHLAAIRRPHR